MEYWRLRDLGTTERQRAVRSLKALRRQLDDRMPRRTADGTLVLGTWNIRNFDDNRFGHGPRLPESFFYLAEVMARFDVVAVQEVCEDLRPLQHLVSILGQGYDFLMTDLTEGVSGNDERLGFVFDREKASFRGVAGEIVLPERLLISDVTRRRQFARTPFACAFRAGWLNFVFATVHIYFGSASKTSAAYKRRVSEIEAVARFLAKRATTEDQTYVLVGDFNIDRFGDPTADALEEARFTVVRNREGSNRTRTKFFDQISFMAREGEVRMSDSETAHGVMPVFDAVFRDDQFEEYDPEVRATLTRRLAALRKELKATEARQSSATRTKALAKLKKAIDALVEVRGKAELRRDYYLTEWRTFQLSDHLPLWVELDVDFTEDYLNRLRSLR